MSRLLIFILLLAYPSLCLSSEWALERRKDQNPTQSAYMILPLPYSKPGIGKGYLLIGTVSNVAETTTDVSGMLVTGDAKGNIINISEMPLYSDNLFLDVYLQNINRVIVNNYSTRGINSTGKKDYTLMDLSVAQEALFDLNLTFFERRLNFYYSHSNSKYQIDAIRDSDGVLISNFSQPFISSDASNRYRGSFELTDDYLDPRKGFRFDVAYQNRKATNQNEPDFYVVDYNLLGYVPVGDVDTLVLNYYQSDARVQRQGNTDPASIRAELGMGCAPADTGCLTAEQELVDNFISARMHGTSTALGGDLRLRSFPQGRYQGAHTAFVGAEYRLNISQAVKPFDYFIWKDVRTGIQVAFFAELGTVSETGGRLWKETRHSIGTGVRLIAASGAVYRADIATGKEGVEMIIIFNYPWE